MVLLQNIKEMESIDLFILTHKDFEIYPKSPEYKIVTCNELYYKYDVPVILEQGEEDSLLPLQKAIGEFSMMNFIYEHYPLNNRYVGFCHHRRYFEFFDKMYHFDGTFLGYDVCVPSPKTLTLSIRDQYAAAHNIEDLDFVEAILLELYGKECLEQWKYYIEQKHLFYPYNMFIMKVPDFIAYMDWMRKIIFKYIEKRGWKTSDDVLKYVSENKEKYPIAEINGVEYHSRLIGFIIERLTSFFLWYCFHDKRVYNLIKMDDAY